MKPTEWFGIFLVLIVVAFAASMCLVGTEAVH